MMNNEIEQQVAKLGIEAYLEQHQNKSLLRFLTCGSVDDGKSSLIGRLLHDSKHIYEDHLAAIYQESQKVGTRGKDTDLALLVDGLQAEREQGITIDVAYRYFSTSVRKFIIADTPGHEQYTRNMATGASTCDLAVILIDARKGVLDQTRRHSFIASLLGIRQCIIAINKMDLVDFDQARFERIKQENSEFSQKLNPDINFHYVPVCALKGDNIVEKSLNTLWYQGETLLSLLETLPIKGAKSNTDLSDTVPADIGLRYPVQYVNRPHLDFRGFAGTLTQGFIEKGSEIKVLPSGKTSFVKSIITFDGELEKAEAGQAITLTLDDEIDISRGDVIVGKNDKVALSDEISVTLVWMSEKALLVGSEYGLKIASKKINALISDIKYQLDINALTPFETNTLPLNGIGECVLSLSQKIPLDLYANCTATGGFILIDPLTNVTVAAGMITKVLEEKDLAQDALDISGILDNKGMLAFEIELNALIRKHFPHWQARDIRQLFDK